MGALRNNEAPSAVRAGFRILGRPGGGQLRGTRLHPCPFAKCVNAAYNNDAAPFEWAKSTAKQQPACQHTLTLGAKYW